MADAVAIPVGEKTNWVKRHWFRLLVGIVLIPILTIQAMRERKEKEAESVFVLDEDIPELKLILTKGGVGEIQYVNGKRQPIDGHGIVTLTLDDFKAQQARFGEVGKTFQDADFPIVVFFNSSAFDATGDPVIVRRAADGEVLFELQSRPKMVRVMSPSRSGGFVIYDWSGKRTELREDVWYRTYVGVDPPKTPTPEELDKMSDEELRRLGIERIPRSDIVKPGEVLFRGVVMRVGGIPAIQPVMTDVLVLRGVVRPTQKLSDDLIVRRLKSNANGEFHTILQAGTEYTVVVYDRGVIVGNSANKNSWPAIKASEQIYEFRLQQ